MDSNHLVNKHQVRKVNLEHLGRKANLEHLVRRVRAIKKESPRKTKKVTKNPKRNQHQKKNHQPRMKQKMVKMQTRKSLSIMLKTIQLKVNRTPNKRTLIIKREKLTPRKRQVKRKRNKNL